jgi:hypothetical protein
LRITLKEGIEGGKEGDFIDIFIGIKFWANPCLMLESTQSHARIKYKIYKNFKKGFAHQHKLSKTFTFQTYYMLLTNIKRPYNSIFILYKHNGNVFTKTLGPTLLATSRGIHEHSCCR